MPQSMLHNKKYFPRWLHILTPKGASTRSGADLAGGWQGTVQAIR
jgi:hypothetical protein